MRTSLRIMAVLILPVLAAACDLAPPGADQPAPEPSETASEEASAPASPTEEPSAPAEEPSAPAEEPSAPAEEEPSAPAEEAPAEDAGFQLPFACGEQWRLDTWAHAPALDMVREPDQTGTEGALLIAPADGVVNQSFTHDNAGNVIQIDHGDGQFSTYIHLQSRAVEAGDEVAQGDEIGRVGRTGPTANNHPHLHFEFAIDANGDGRASWGTADSERVTPTFDGVEYGQANGQTWRNVTSNNSC